MKKFFYQHEARPAQQLCDFPACVEEGHFRAPKSRSQVGSNLPNDFHWFCLEHVREYNKSWNYFRGMSDEEALKEAYWSRPTWPMGRWSHRSQAFRHIHQGSYEDPFGIFNTDTRSKPPPYSYSPSDIEAKAMAVLELEYPYTFHHLRAQYLILVKKHHPDTNGGSQEGEERVKQVNEAYLYLKEKLKEY